MASRTSAIAPLPQQEQPSRKRRTLIAAAPVAAILGAQSSAAQAQAYPNKQVRIARRVADSETQK